jgi:DNA-binding XRE family transcriptional regulator
MKNLGKDKMIPNAAVCDQEQSLLAEASGGVAMKARQCRAARALLNWTQKELGEKARVSDMTIRQFELGTTNPMRATLDALQRALEKAGVEFIEDDGVRMKRRRR